MASDGGGGASEGRGFRGCATDVDVDRYTDVSSLGIRAAGWIGILIRAGSVGKDAVIAKTREWL
mgnify:CR=1 FL=1